MAGPAKRHEVFTYLRTLSADIICLQETNASDNQDFWTQQWGQSAAWTSYLGILCTRSTTILSYQTFANERIILCHLQSRGTTYSIINMYAPPTYRERKPFFEALLGLPIDYATVDFLLGDWNDVPNSVQDRLSTAQRPPQSAWPSLQPVLTTFLDAAMAGAAQQFYTFSHTGRYFEGRLDHIFASSRYQSFAFSTSVTPTSLSDHSVLSVTISPPSYQLPILRRVNAALLSSKPLQDAIAALTPNTGDTLEWDICKILYRSTALDYQALAAKARHCERRRLERNLSKATHEYRHNPQDILAKTKVDLTREALQASMTYESERAALRSQTRWLEVGETSSNYFFSRYRNRHQTANLSTILDDLGAPFPSAEARQTHITSFYSTLYATPPSDLHAIDRFLSSINLPHLSPAECSALTSPFSPEELAAAIRTLPCQSSPGPDGIPYEWYKQFLPQLGPFLLDIFNSVLAGNSPPLLWARTYITLIPKPDRDHTKIQNWRPITLSNTDCKIYSRLWANRLASILPRLLHKDQAGFVKGRHAADNAMSLRAVLGHAATKNVPGAIVFLDQEKAYDRIARPYLVQVLHQFGFPPQVITALTASYEPTFAHILDNGQPLEGFSVNCGVRQGDPLAPLLFNIALEPFLQAIRTHLQGIRLPWGQFIIGAYADDLHVGLAPTDVPTFNRILQEYCFVSNSRININKSSILTLSLSNPSPHWLSSLPYPLHPPTEPIRVLGYKLQLNPSGISDDWQSLFTKIKASTQLMANRNCSLVGRSLLVKALIFSKLWYFGRMSSPSSQMLRNIRNLGWNMVWRNHTALVPPLLIGRRPWTQGGVSFLDPKAQLTALQAQWFKTFLTSQQPPPWTTALSHAFSQLPGNQTCLASPIPKQIVKRLPMYWREFAQAWSQLNPHWPEDITSWTPAYAQSFPLPNSASSAFPTGIPLGRLLVTQPGCLTASIQSHSEIQQRFQRAAPVRICTALDNVLTHPNSLPARLLSLLTSIPLPLPPPIPIDSLLSNIIIADRPLEDLTTTNARKFIDHQDGVNQALDWSTRHIARYGLPPPDIWRRVHSPARLPIHREQWYKLLYNAQPLGERVFHFWPEQLCCHACPPTPQTIRHFLYTCPLAKAVWNEFKTVLDLSHEVTFQQALYSWPSSSSSVLGCTTAFKLQAGHAIAIYTLWTAHTQAIFDEVRTNSAAIRLRFRSLLARHLSTIQSSHYGNRLT